MKKILIATDFSEASQNAGKYAASLAAAFNARIILFHVYQPIFAAADISQYVVSADIKQMALHDLAEEANVLNTEKRPGFYTFAEEGPIAKTICQKAAEHKVDLVVVGMKAKHKGLRKIFGSTVTELLKKSAVPLMIIPEGTHFRGINVLAVASGTDIPVHIDPHLLDVVAALSEQFRAATYVVGISKSRVEEAFHLLNRPYRLMKMVGHSDAMYEVVRNKDVTDGLTHFIENFHADVLVLPRYQLSRTDRLFHHSITRDMIYQSHIPLLVIPG